MIASDMYLYAGWGADSQFRSGLAGPAGGFEAAAAASKEEGEGEASWAIAVTRVAVWCGRWRGRPPSQPARGNSRSTAKLKPAITATMTKTLFAFVVDGSSSAAHLGQG